MEIMQINGKILSDMIMLVTCEYLWGPLDKVNNSENAILKFILVDMVSENFILWISYATQCFSAHWKSSRELATIQVAIRNIRNRLRFG